MKRSLGSALLLALAYSAVLVSPVLGDPPERGPVPPPAGTVLDLPNGYCPFDAELTFVVNNETIVTFTNGGQIITGKLFANVRNLESLESIDINISGPGFTSLTSSSLLLSGRSLVFFSSGELGPGSEGFMLLTSGPVLIDFSGAFPTLTMTAADASVRDICAELA